MSYKFPLQSDPFTYQDRLKACSFLLNKNNRLTMGEKVLQLETLMSVKYQSACLAVSSGSAANHLIFELWKQKNPEKFKNSLVIAPAVTWMSSVSPAIMSGYEVQFCDINLNDFCFDYKMLESIIKKNKKKNCIIWPTALIGFCPDFNRLENLKYHYNAELWLDSCENLFSTYNGQSILSYTNCSSLSAYHAHQLNGIELGFVFIKDEKDYQLAKMLRNHGLTRSLPNGNELRETIERDNFSFDKQFLFGAIGTNWRTTEINALFALQDFKRIDENKEHSKKIQYRFYDQLNKSLYYLPQELITVQNANHVLFCLPIFRKDKDMRWCKYELDMAGWETRPIIGSCITMQPALKKYHSNKFKNAMWVHEHGFYVGLSRTLKEKDVDKLCSILNNI